MFTAIRRVISESSLGALIGQQEQQQQPHAADDDDQQQALQQQAQALQQQAQALQQYPQQAQHSPEQHQHHHQHQRVNLVEMESDDFMDVDDDDDDHNNHNNHTRNVLTDGDDDDDHQVIDDNAPVSHIRRSSGQYGSTDSSLSGVSEQQLDQVEDDDYAMEHDDTAEDAYMTMTNNMTNNMTKEQQLAALQRTAGALGLQVTRTTTDTDTGDDESSGSMRAASQNSSRDWGWFEDVHHPSEHAEKKKSKGKKAKGTLVPIQDTVRDVLHHQADTDAAAMAVTAPTYVLEESMSSQRLWKDTAGQRPPQPVEERCFYEKMWAQNFARSQVEYQMPVEVLTATSPISLSPFCDGNFEGPSTVPELSNYNLAAEDTTKDQVTETVLVSRLHETHDPHSRHTVVNKKVKGTDSAGDLTVLVRGDNAFGTTVSKSFARPNERGGPIQGVDTVNISIASYRVVETKNHGKYAQFLVIYREGSIRDTIGVWKRYSDFEELARKVTQSHEGCVAVIANMSPLAITEEPEHEQLPNAMTSWRLLKKRQRWFRCLDAGYLSLKVFLLERFLHDILFESTSPNLLREFVVTESTMMPSP